MKTKSGARRKTPKKTSKSAAAPSVNGTTAQPLPEVFTLREAAEFLRVGEDEILKLAEAGKLPAKKFGDDWRILKAALCEWLSQPEATEQPIDWKESNRRLLAMAGSMSHDDTVPEMLENIYRERKRHPVSEIQD